MSKKELTHRDVLELCGLDPSVERIVFSGPTRYYLLDNGKIEVDQVFFPKYNIDLVNLANMLKKRLNDYNKPIENTPWSKHILYRLVLDKNSIDERVAQSVVNLSNAFSLPVEKLDFSRKSLSSLSKTISRDKAIKMVDEDGFLDLVFYLGEVFRIETKGTWEVVKRRGIDEVYIRWQTKLHNPWSPLYDELYEGQSTNPDLQGVLKLIYIERVDIP